MANTILGICAAVIGLYLLLNFVFKYDAFMRQKRFIDMEIGRSTGEQLKKWKRRRRRLWRIFLPRL